MSVFASFSNYRPCVTVLAPCDWGNGRSEARNAPTTKNTWATSGTYNIALTVTDGAGLTSPLAKSVVIP